MTNKNKKAQSIEFYCSKCREWKVKGLKQKGEVHCISCEKRGIETVKNYVDKPQVQATKTTLEARELRTRAADLMLEMEIKQANDGHLAG